MSGEITEAAREAAHRAFVAASEKGCFNAICPAASDKARGHDMLCDEVAAEIDRAARDALRACGA